MKPNIKSKQYHQCMQPIFHFQKTQYKKPSKWSSIIRIIQSPSSELCEDKNEQKLSNSINNFSAQIYAEKPKMVLVNIELQMSSLTKTSVQIISTTTKLTQQRKMVGKTEKVSRTKKETIHLQIDTISKEDNVPKPTQSTQKKGQIQQPQQRQKKRKKEVNEKIEDGLKRRKRKFQKLQQPTVTMSKKKEKPNALSESKKEENEEGTVHGKGIQQTTECDDGQQTFQEKTVTLLTKVTDQEVDTEAIKKNDVQGKMQTIGRTTAKKRKKIMGATPSFSLNLKDEPSSQLDDFSPTNHRDKSMQWTQLQVYNMLKPDDRRRLIQFSLTEDT